MTTPGILAGAVEIVLNRYLSLNPGAAQQLAHLQGKVLAIKFTDLDIALYCMAGKHNLCVHTQEPEQVDTIIQGSIGGLIKLGGSGDSNGLFTGDVKIEGDVEAGEAFQNLLSSKHIDWEEQLSHLTGDIAAYRIGLAAKSAGRWTQRSSSSLEEDLRDYLQEESRILPHPIEVEQFTQRVDTLRDDCARLEARVRRLENAGDEDA